MRSVQNALVAGVVCSMLSSAPLLAAPRDDMQATLQEILKEMKSLRQRVDTLERDEHAGSKESDTTHAAKEDLDRLTKKTEQVANAANPNLVEASAEPNAATTVGGYMSTEFEKFRGQDSTFDQHRLVVNVGSRINERLKFYSEVEYEHGGGVEAEGSGKGNISIKDKNGNGVIDADEANDITVATENRNGHGGEIAVEQAWAQYDINQWIGLRGGILLVPFGKYNLSHDDDLHLLTDRPLVDRVVIPTTWSEAGAGFVTNHPLGEEAKLSSEFYFVNGINDDISNEGGGFHEATGSLEEDNNNNKAVAGRLAFSPWIGHEVGLSGYQGSYDDGKDVRGAAFDFDSRLGNWRVLGEAALLNASKGITLDGDVTPSRLSGLYGEVQYDFWFEALNRTFLGEGFGAPTFTGLFRYNYAEQNRREGQGLSENSYVVGLAYRPVRNFIFKTEYQFNDGQLERGNNDGFLSSVAVGF